MVETTLLDYAAQGVQAGQRQLAGEMKQLVSTSDVSIAERLNYADDDAFLEPLLFTYFCSRAPRLTLDQILYGYVSEDARPAQIRAHTGPNGVVCLPQLGYALTALPDADVVLTRHRSSSSLTLHRNGQPVPFTFDPIRRVAETRVEIHSHIDPFFDLFFPDESDHHLAAMHCAVTAQHELSIATALEIMARVTPSAHASLMAVTRGLHGFRCAGVDSFASVSAHGVGFLRVPDSAHEVFFIEDLAHQCGHILFNALTVQRDELFQVDPDTPVGTFTGRSSDDRTLYVAVHGVFTECLMSICLYRCHAMRIFDGAKKHELLGRLSLILKRMSMDLVNLNYTGIFSSSGTALFAEFKRIFDGLYRLAKDDIVGFDLSNQPYAFDLEKLLARNPCPER